MARTTLESKDETVTFRIAPALKAAFAELAEQERKPLGELLREMVRERVEQKQRSEFEIEARRQSLAAAALAENPDSDEAAVMRELEADLEEFSKEWK
jgi:uncharacterized membrane protein